MPIDWDSVLYDPIYDELGVTATITGAEFGQIALTVIDKTNGIVIEANGIALPTIKPAVCIRSADLAARSILATDLHNATLELNGYTWRIANTQQRPGPSGKGSGEILMMLERATP